MLYDLTIGRIRKKMGFIKVERVRVVPRDWRTHGGREEQER
jgi:hypothetical protein